MRSTARGGRGPGPRPDPPRHHATHPATRRSSLGTSPTTSARPGSSASWSPARRTAPTSWPGCPAPSRTSPSLAFVGHTDVVPVDARDWTHPPFEGVVDDAGYLYGRGALDMKGEVAARAVALKELARSGWRPRGDLWFLAVADEEDGMADVGMRWLLEHRPDIRPDLSVNEGGGERFELTRRAGAAGASGSARRAPTPRASPPSARPATAARRPSATTRCPISARCWPGSAAACPTRSGTSSSTRC